jgi:hypothetical protein
LAAVDAITTRNVSDFVKSAITVFDPTELVAAVKARQSANHAPEDASLRSDPQR